MTRKFRVGDRASIVFVNGHTVRGAIVSGPIDDETGRPHRERGWLWFQPDDPFAKDAPMFLPANRVFGEHEEGPR